MDGWRVLLVLTAWAASCCLTPASASSLADLRAAKEAQLLEARAALRRAEAELADVRVQEAQAAASPSVRPAETCVASASGAATRHARIRSAEPAAAAAYVSRQHQQRAQYYVKSAMRSFHAGLRQLSGDDKSNSDPFIRQYEGFNQVLGALDLAPDDAKVWMEAGKATAMLSTLLDTGEGRAEALSFMARACRLDPATLPTLTKWLKAGGKDLPKAARAVKKQMWQTVRSWNETGDVPDLPVTAFAWPLSGDSCASGFVGEAKSRDLVFSDDTVDKALQEPRVSNIFPTRIVSWNVRRHVPQGFAERLSKLAADKYKAFGKRSPGIEPNDLNDKFFSFQVTDERTLSSNSKELDRWPDMYRRSDDFKLLVRLMKGALLHFLNVTGVEATAADANEYSAVMWAAVYPGHGGRHGYHVHQGSLSSCVIYLQTAGATTPIIFVDPRGAPPVNDYEQHIGERDFEPVAPFHHSEHFFPEVGDVVCFPSWLVHTVPSHWEEATRVAFAANFQGHGAWDSWLRTVASWN